MWIDQYSGWNKKEKLSRHSSNRLFRLIRLTWWVDKSSRTCHLLLEWLLHPSDAHLHCCSNRSPLSFNFCKIWILQTYHRLWKHPQLHSAYTVLYSLIYYPNEYAAFGAKVGESGCFHTTTCIFERKTFYLSETNSPLWSLGTMLRDDGWYFEECKRLTRRSFFVSFSAGIFKPCLLFSFLFNFLFEAIFWKKKVSYFWTGWYSLPFIFIWAKFWGNVCIYPKFFSISLYLSLYTQCIYHMFCC